MKTRPILFSTEMVAAILDGSKTQTRRIKKSDKCPYGQVGDVLEPAIYIPGFGSKYCASYDGNIYSKARGEWKLLKPFSGHKGYLNVTLMDGKRKTTRNIHTLVCTAFHGVPDPGMQVRHLDGDPSNNCAGNLKWGTQIENWQDRKAHGNGIEGEKHHSSKFTDEERSHIKWAIEMGLCSQRHAARVLKHSQQNIWQICHPERLVQPTEEIPPACRIRLQITDIRVERLQDITEEYARAEGLARISKDGGRTWKYGIPDTDGLPGTDDNGWEWREWNTSPVSAFKTLWGKINGPESWDANPYVWVIQFKKI